MKHRIRDLFLLLYCLFGMEFCFAAVSYFTEIEKCKVTTHGKEYIGNISQSKTGNKCVQWSKEIIEKLSVQEILFPDMDLIFAHNHCRNPTDYPSGPWCIVDQTTLKWEYCNIPTCIKDRNWCKDSKSGVEYLGDLNITKYGKECKSWMNQNNYGALQFADNNLKEAGNKCRNPDGYEWNPWCYTVDGNPRWDECDVPKCDEKFSQMEYFGGYDFLKTIDNLNVIGMANVYKSGTFIVSIGLDKLTGDVRRKTSVWATEYDPKCQKDLNEYEYCKVTRSFVKGNQANIIYSCLRPFKNLIVISPLTKAEYSVSYKLGSLQAKNEDPGPEFLQYQKKLQKHFGPRKSSSNIPVTDNHGYLILLNENVVPYAMTPKKQVVVTLSEVGKGKIGFMATEKHIEKTFVPNIKDFLNLVFENDDVSLIDLDTNILTEIYSQRKSKDLSSSLVIWNAHNQIGEKNVKLLLELIRDGLRIIIGIKPWAYHHYREFLSNSELKSVFLAAGVWPSMSSSSENLIVLNGIVVETFPLVYLLDYAKTSLSNAIQVSESISNALLETPFEDLIGDANFEAISEKIKTLFPIYLHEVKSRIPCWDKTLTNNNDRALIKLINAMLIQPLGNKFVAPGLSFYPGKLRSDDIQTISIKMKLNLQFNDEVVQLGLYIPAGEDVSVKISKSKSETCQLYVNHHQFDVVNKDDWYKWPISNTKYVIQRDQMKTFSFAFGGILSLSCKENNDKVEIILTGVVQIPMFDRRDNELNKDWNKLQKVNTPWAVLSSDTVVFVLSSNAIRNMGQPGKVMEMYDLMVKEELHLRGKLVASKRRELVSTDMQIKAGYMHAGYPIGTQIPHVTNPSLESKYLFHVKYIKKEGSWGILHEIGHNLQENSFTFTGTTDITNNIFTLVAMERMTLNYSWSPTEGWVSEESYMTRFVSYINEGKFQEWLDEPFLGLAIYAQLRAHFGWELYRQVFRKYDILSIKLGEISNDDAIQLWIKETSIHTKMNLCPLYELWRWPIEEKTKIELTEYPAFMPIDFLTIKVEFRIKEIIEKYGGPLKVTRQPLKIPIIIGSLEDSVYIEGQKIIEEMKILT